MTRPHSRAARLHAAWTCLCLAHSVHAAESLHTWVIEDRLDHRWADELVHFDFDVATRAKALHLTDADGSPATCQLSDVRRDERQGRISGTVWTVVTVEPSSRVVLHLRPGETEAVTSLAIARGADQISLSNDRMGVALGSWPGQIQLPARLTDLPAPVLSVSAPGGRPLGSGSWINTGPALEVKEASTQVIEQGPVRMVVRQRMLFADGGTYEATVTLGARQDAALVAERCTVDAPRAAFRFSMQPGLKADRVFWHNQWRKTANAATWSKVLTEVDFDQEHVVCKLCPWSFWWIGDVAECERQYARFVDLYLSTDDVSPAVVELAAQVAPRDTYSSDYEVASAVQRYLEDPQNFSYTLDLSDYAGDDVDPMEHFLFESKAGHCSLFASAMVLMLRAQGVPARIVNGFRGGRWSNMTESYSIQGNYAHSWAEVYFPGHGWVVFDPTPGASIDVSGQRYLANWGEELQGWVRMQWDRYVIAFERQQQEAIYTKLNAAGKRFATAVHAWVNKRSAALAKLSWKNLSVRARIVAGVIALLLAVALWYLVAKLVPVMARKAFGRTRRLAGTAPVPKELRFYPTLLDALAKNGYARRSSVPAMTFAAEVASKNPAVGAPLCDLTALYYRARYGHKTLSRTDHHRAHGLAKETLVACRRHRG